MTVAGQAEQAVNQLFGRIVAIDGLQCRGRDDDGLPLGNLGIRQAQRATGRIGNRERRKKPTRPAPDSGALVVDGEGVDLQCGVVRLINAAIALGGQQTLVTILDGKLEVGGVAGAVQRHKLDVACSQVGLGERIPDRQRQARGCVGQVATCRDFRERVGQLRVGRIGIGDLQHRGRDGDCGGRARRAWRGIRPKCHPGVGGQYRVVVVGQHHQVDGFVCTDRWRTGAAAGVGHADDEVVAAGFAAVMAVGKQRKVCAVDDLVGHNRHSAVEEGAIGRQRLDGDRVHGVIRVGYHQVAARATNHRQCAADQSHVLLAFNQDDVAAGVGQLVDGGQVDGHRLVLHQAARAVVYGQDDAVSVASGDLAAIVLVRQARNLAQRKGGAYRQLVATEQKNALAGKSTGSHLYDDLIGRVVHVGQPKVDLHHRASGDAGSRGRCKQNAAAFGRTQAAGLARCGWVQRGRVVLRRDGDRAGEVGDAPVGGVGDGQRKGVGVTGLRRAGVGVCQACDPALHRGAVAGKAGLV